MWKGEKDGENSIRQLILLRYIRDISGKEDDSKMVSNFLHYNAVN